MQIRTDELVAVYNWSLKILILLTEYHTFVLKLVLRIKSRIFIPDDGLAPFLDKIYCKDILSRKMRSFTVFFFRARRLSGKAKESNKFG